ncbi:MAG: agmatinase family protein [Candidatus Competibacter sp.]
MKDLPHEGHMKCGIQTFMKSPYVGLDEAYSYDVAFLGIPVEYGMSYRKGAALGPKAVREYSYWDAVSNTEYWDIDTDTQVYAHTLRICDLGDIHITPTNPEVSGARIASTVQEVRKACFPLIIGGDHSIAYWTLKGILQPLADEQRLRIGLLHFDAHLDMERPYIDLPAVFHGNPFRKLIEEGIISGHQHYAIGQRGIVPKYLRDFVHDTGVQMYPMKCLREHGFEHSISRIIEEMRERFNAVYVTCDVDVIDGGIMCGTGTPVSNGLLPHEMEYAVRKLQKILTIGFELVELAPKLDVSGFSTMIACNILWQFLSFGFSQKNHSVMQTL